MLSISIIKNNFFLNTNSAIPTHTLDTYLATSKKSIRTLEQFGGLKVTDIYVSIDWEKLKIYFETLL